MTGPKFILTFCLLTLLPIAAVAWEKDKPATPPVIPANPNHLPKAMARQVADSILKALGGEEQTE